MRLKFKIECEMEAEQIVEFYSILKTMERLGVRGSSRTLNIFSDGDGKFRPVFKIDDVEDVDNEDEIILAIEEEATNKTSMMLDTNKDYKYSLE